MGVSVFELRGPFFVSNQLHEEGSFLASWQSLS